MKKITALLIGFSILLPAIISGQGKPNFVGEWYHRSSQGKSPVAVDALKPDKSDFPRTKRYNLKANLNQLNSIMRTKPELVNLIVPYGNRTYTLNLAKVDVVGEAFDVKTNQGNVNHDSGVQYRGIVDNNPAQIASLSLTETDKSAFFSTGEGNFVITKEGANYIVYNDQEMELPGVIYCETPSVSYPINVDPQLISGVGCKTVNIYFECDHAFYLNKGSNITTLTNYIIGFFNQVATIYANEDIAMKISGIFAWTSPDPYANMSSNSDIMNAFKANRGTTFNGHIAHFLSTRTPLGGIAYVNTLCNKAYAYGVSRISSTYQNFPTYSWTVNVVAHELGHTLGSPHTHSCTWSGGPIDNCVAQEGTCSPGPTPAVGGGTIMSYCHITNVGINFNNGFGLLPGNLIRSKVSTGTCVAAGTEASPPTSLSTTNITASSATLNWAVAPSTTSYTVQYKLATASGWTPAGTTSTTSINLIGLTANANYVWTVKSDCSPFAANASFTTTGSSGTGCAAPTQLASSVITQTGATLTWAAVSGATGYTVQYKTSAASTWVSVNATTNSYALTGLVAGTTYNWQVKANCSSYSTQASFTTATTSTGCSAPGSLATTNITQTGATLNWGAVSGATGYTVQYKTSAASTWITTTATSNSRVISGLVAGTNYVWQVKASCSAYSAQASFSTTSTSGCSAPVQLASTNITQSAATLTWAAVSGATSYTIQYRKTSTSTWTTVTSSTNSRSISSLSAGTNYIWQVKTNCSAYSTQATFTTTASSSGCSVPTNLSTTSITNNAATVNWTGPANAVSYSIRYKRVGFSGWTIRTNITGSSYRITGLSSKLNYEWIINAKCSNGTSSSFSSKVTFTTL